MTADRKRGASRRSTLRLAKPCTTMNVECNVCGLQLKDADKSCPKCGGPVSRTIHPRTGHFEVVGHPIGAVSEHGDPDGARSVEYSAPSGARSTASVSEHDVRLDIKGPADVGKRGQRRVVDAVLTILRTAGLVVEEEEGRDDRGEDHVLHIESQRVVLQIVSAPDDPKLWRAVASGTGSAEGTPEEALAWIEGTVRAKADRYDPRLRRSMLLAIDAAHAGVLAFEARAKAYLDRYGDPSEKYGFAAVWLVGPAAHISVRLGTSQW